MVTHISLTIFIYYLCDWSLENGNKLEIIFMISIYLINLLTTKGIASKDMATKVITTKGIDYKAYR